MAFGVLATVVEGIDVDDPDVVTKSWPGLLGRPSRSIIETVHAGDRRRRLRRRRHGDDPRLRRAVPPARRRHGADGGAAGPCRSTALAPALARRDRDALKALATRAVFTGRPIADVEDAG